MSEEISKKVLDVIDRIMCNDPNMRFANFGGKCVMLQLLVDVVANVVNAVWMTMCGALQHNMNREVEP